MESGGVHIRAGYLAGMSTANVELVRKIYEAWGRGNSARDFIAPDVEYVNPNYAVEPGTRLGRKSFAVVGDTYTDFDMQAERFIDAGGEDVVVLAHYRGSGRGSGVPVEGEQGHIWAVRGGLATRFRWFQSHQEALEAAGLTDS